ncbi:MAG TPA: formimidoylglutamate deiminase [Caldimonas sp.]|nr:formimidoylglutamate deiminase [Caldimonas sp.]
MPADASSSPAHLWAPLAWLPDGWREHVVARADESGRWAEVTAGVATAPPGAQVVAGPLLPGVVDAHSHAFQRAFVAGAETRDGTHDDFWSWRARMYAVALRISPAQLRAVAAHLYLELLRGGYTHVCEFHYLRRDVDGSDYADPLAMSWALADAAADVGIGLTILPVLYERASFAAALRDDQRRFRADARATFDAAARIRAAARPLVDAGVAIHSLRAASAESIAALRELVDGDAAPIHIHVAEQTGEVDECVRVTGRRPIEWLASERVLDARWQLVHATHASVDEIAAVAASGAGVVVCPTTEANLGDGVFDLPAWLGARVPLALGSDSQATRDWREELRLLEYAQRLVRRARNVAAAPELGVASSAERLFARAIAGGAAAAGQRSWGLVAGARADALVVDVGDPALRGVAATKMLDALVFSSPTLPWQDVVVAGRWRVRAGRHRGAAAIARRYDAAIEALSGSATARPS